MLACVPLPLTLLAGNEARVLLYAPEATISRLEASARASDGRVLIQWQTTLELGVDAFVVQRQRNGGAPEPVGLGYVRTHGNDDGEAYELSDPLVQAGDAVRYNLFIASRHGQNQLIATWTGIVQRAASPPKSLMTPSASSSATAVPVPLALAQPWIGAVARVLSWTNSVPADRVRLSLREEGIYRVTAQELADASGWPVASVTSAIANTNLSMSCQGAPVAWYADGSNLLFHGVPAESRFAPENVYWVAPAPGSNMSRRVMTPEMPATTNQWFYNQIMRQGTDYLNRVSYSSLADSSAPYVAFSPSLLAGSMKQFSETLPNCATSVWSGEVTVNLLSFYDSDVGSDNHAACVWLGGTLVGTPSWVGEQYVSITYPFSSTNLANGIATLLVSNVTSTTQPPPTYTRFLCMSYGLSYASLYRAQNNALRCTGGTSDTVSVAGFTTNDILALDVTVTRAPAVVEPVTLSYDGVAGNWTAAFPSGGTGQIYQVFSMTSATRQPSIRGVRDVDWSSPTNRADYVILIPPEGWRDGFRQAMTPLADYRNAQGLRTLVVDVESLYNRYSYGLVDPLAISAFCRDGYTNWSTHPLRYVLLAGAGSVDFKHQRLSVTDYTACLIPTMIVGQRLSSGEGMTVAVDAKLGDVNNDDLPDVIVGRLPTTRTDELAVVVQKTMAYEKGQQWRQSASVAADWDNIWPKYYPFSAGTEKLIEPLARPGRRVVKHYITGSSSGAIVRVNSLFPALNAGGAGLFYFFGHTSEVSLGGGDVKLLTSPTHISSSYWQKPPIAVFMGCLPNRWHGISSTTVNCIVPYGLFAANTGFAAGLGATGYMMANEEEDLSKDLFADEGVSGTRRLGDFWRNGLQRRNRSVPSERILCFSLIGDPTLVFYYTTPLIIMIR